MYVQYMAEMILNRLAEIQFNTFLNVPIYLDIHFIYIQMMYILYLIYWKCCILPKNAKWYTAKCNTYICVEYWNFSRLLFLKVLTLPFFPLFSRKALCCMVLYGDIGANGECFGHALLSVYSCVKSCEKDLFVRKLRVLS